MRLHFIGKILMGLGALVLTLGLATPTFFAEKFMTEKLAGEYSKASEAYHEAINGRATQSRHNAKEIARKQFEEIQKVVENRKQWRDKSAWLLNTAGLLLIIGGGLLFSGGKLSSG